MFQKLYTRYAERVKPLNSQPIEVQILSSNTIDILQAFDISLKGIGVRTPNSYELVPPKKEMVELVITLPGNRPFKAQGYVRHITARKRKEDCFGVEFVSIANKSLSNIRHYMEETKLLRTKLAC